MASVQHPRARITIEVAQGLVAGQLLSMMESAKSSLQSKLITTGLNLVGLPVIDEIGKDYIRLSWKVYNQYPTEEEERG